MILVNQFDAISSILNLVLKCFQYNSVVMGDIGNSNLIQYLRILPIFDIFDTIPHSCFIYGNYFKNTNMSTWFQPVSSF